MIQAWVSDSGTAVLVHTTEAERHQFHLWSFQEGNPSSPLPKQVQPALCAKLSWHRSNIKPCVALTDACHQLYLLTQDALDMSQS